MKTQTALLSSHIIILDDGAQGEFPVYARFYFYHDGKFHEFETQLLAEAWCDDLGFTHNISIVEPEELS